MGKFLLLAFRNVFRNRRRTIMTLCMVGGGVAGLLLAGGYFAFMTHGLRESTINDGLGHLQIFTADHFRRDEVRVLDTGIENWRQVAAKSHLGAARARRGSAHRVLRHGLKRNQGRRIHGQRRRSGRGKEPRIHHPCGRGARSGCQPSGRGGGADRRGSGQVNGRQSRRRIDGAGHDFRWRAEWRRCPDRGHRQLRRRRTGCALCAHHSARGAAPAAKRSRHQPGGRPGLDRQHRPGLRRADSAPARLAAADDAEEMDRPGHLLQAGQHHVQRHLPLHGRDCLLHGSHVEREHAC